MRKELGLAAVLLAACSAAKPGEPPRIRYGVDVCSRCGMALSEERFASGWVDPEGRSVVFDDVGEFREALKSRPDLAGLSFVHDADDGRWIKAAEAYFIRVPGLATPMGSGMAAFATQDRARAFAARLGAGALPAKLTAER